MLLGPLAVPAAAQRGVLESEVRRVERLSAPESAALDARLGELRRGLGRTARPDVQEGSIDRPAIMLTGYWPPSNEMLRRFSPDPVQNPLGWIGSDWEGRGYDVYAYFPEFPNPDCSSCGQGMGDLEVDYQDTSTDFWAIADNIQPLAVITFSRGFDDMSWEIEMNQFNRENWIADFTPPVQPTPAPPNQAAPAGSLLVSTHPVQKLQAVIANAGLGLDASICFSGDGGGYLSEFAAYHGAWYQSLHADPSDPAWCIAGGHVHVGAQIDWDTARLAAEETVRTIADHLDDTLKPRLCQPDVGFAGPGVASMTACGDVLTAGGEFDVVVEGASPNSLGWMVFGPQFQPTPFFSGVLVPVPAPVVFLATTNAVGSFGLYNLSLGLPAGAKVYGQYAFLDPSLPGLFGLTNAVELQFQ